MDRFLSKIAFYVTARKPKELSNLPSATLDALLCFLPGRRRVTSFGTWRKSRARSATSKPNPDTGEPA